MKKRYVVTNALFYGGNSFGQVFETLAEAEALRDKINSLARRGLCAWAEIIEEDAPGRCVVVD